MKLDRHGIRFNIWLFFLLFAVGIVLMLGILQFSLVRPYYRSNQVHTVEHVADELENSLLNENRNQEDIEQANRTVFPTMSVYRSSTVRVRSCTDRTISATDVFSIFRTAMSAVRLYRSVIQLRCRIICSRTEDCSG